MERIPDERIPDVLGKPLGKAEASVRGAGLIPRIIITSPPNRREREGSFRVVRQRLLPNRHMELVIAKEKGGKEVGEDAL